MENPDIQDRINACERAFDQFISEGSVDEIGASLGAAVDDFNAWLEEEKNEIQKQATLIAKDLESLRHTEAEIDASAKRLEDEKPDPGNAEATQAFNDLVKAHNDLVRTHQERGSAYQRAQTDHNAQVDGLNQQAERRRRDVESLQKEAQQEHDTLRAWQEGGGLGRLADEVNSLYAQLRRSSRDPSPAPETAPLIDRTQALRKALGAYAAKTQKQDAHGMTLTEATLCGDEPSYLIVDIAASLTTITPELVEALGLQEHVGDEVELALPNAIRIKAPQLLIPKLEVSDMEAEFVKAVVLKSPMPGVDGCLGLSFLNRFDFTIENKDSRGLQLRPLERTLAGPTFDVFICHKSEDIQLARRVYDALTQANYHPFLSEESLESMGNTEYQKAIDTALETARHLVVICSSGACTRSPWVEAEWRLFDGLKRSGRTTGNIIPVLCNNMNRRDLPLALRRYQAIPIDAPDFDETLMSYLPR